MQRLILAQKRSDTTYVTMSSFSFQMAVLLSQFKAKQQLKTKTSQKSMLSLFRLLDRDNNGEVCEHFNEIYI